MYSDLHPTPYENSQQATPFRYQAAMQQDQQMMVPYQFQFQQPEDGLMLVPQGYVRAPMYYQYRVQVQQKPNRPELFTAPNDIKPRLRWTRELHAHFVKAVNQLGGASKAKPKAISEIMKTRGLTVSHVKSHLQKYRMGRPTGRIWKREASVGRGRRTSSFTYTLQIQESSSPMISVVSKESEPRAQQDLGYLHLQVEKQAEMHQGPGKQVQEHASSDTHSSIHFQHSKMGEMCSYPMNFFTDAVKVHVSGEEENVSFQPI